MMSLDFGSSSDSVDGFSKMAQAINQTFSDNFEKGERDYLAKLVDIFRDVPVSSNVLYQSPQSQSPKGHLEHKKDDETNWAKAQTSVSGGNPKNNIINSTQTKRYTLSYKMWVGGHMGILWEFLTYISYL